MAHWSHLDLGIAECQFLSGGIIWLNIHRLVTITGTESNGGLSVGLPVNAATPAMPASTFQNLNADPTSTELRRHRRLQ